jgi:hypothetical protein
VKYVLLIYSNPATWDALSEEERDRLGPEHAALISELIATGEWVGGNALDAPDSTRTVGVRGGVPATTRRAVPGGQGAHGRL